MKRGCPISGNLFYLCKNEGANSKSDTLLRDHLRIISFSTLRVRCIAIR